MSTPAGDLSADAVDELWKKRFQPLTVQVALLWSSSSDGEPTSLPPEAFDQRMTLGKAWNGRNSILTAPHGAFNALGDVTYCVKAHNDAKGEVHFWMPIFISFGAPSSLLIF